MAGKGIEIDIAANARDFQRGVKDVEKGLEEVADALDDVSRDADKTGGKLGDEISDGAKDAERSVEKLERKFKDVAEASKRETRNAGDAMKSNTKEATTQAARDLEELKGEALQNASETFSSFDGSMSSFADGVQGTFGGIVSNMGPVGAAAGAAGAIGIGLIMKAFDDAKISEEEFREKVRGLAEELIETGGVGETSLGYIAEQLKGLALEGDDGAISLERIRRESARLGLDFRDLSTAYAGGTEALEDQISTLDELIDQEQKRYADGVNQYNVFSGAVDTTSKSLKEQRDALKRVAEATEEARQQELDFIETGGAAAAARAEQMDALQSELDDAIGSWKDYYDAETGATDPAGYIANMQARMAATSNFNGNVQQLAQQFGLSFEEQQAILDQGVDFAPVLQSIIDSGMGEQYAATVRSMLDGGQSIIEGTPLTSTVTTQADTSAAEQQLDSAAQGRETEIEAEASTTTAARQLDSLAEKKRTATITADLDMAAAEAALRRFIERQRTVTVTVEARDREGRYVP